MTDTAHTAVPAPVGRSSRSARRAWDGPRSRAALGAALILAALAVACVLSMLLGAKPIPLDESWRVLWHPDGSEASLIVWTMRMPRTVLGLATGAAFGVAGALIQAITRNPLADPGILGVNAGAGFAVTLGVGLVGISGIGAYVWWSFLGAAAATILVYLIGSAAGRGSASPMTLVLVGVALGAVLNGFSTFLTLIDEQTFRSIRRWGVGSIARADDATTLSVLPFLVVGLLLAVAISGSLNSVALGDDLAASLGTSVVRVRVLGLVSVTLLAGGATALTGGIAFIGLMIPHIARWVVGPDQRLIIIWSAVGAPVLVLLADVAGRVLGAPGEIEVGLVSAIIGAPVLILLARRRKASGL